MFEGRGVAFGQACAAAVDASVERVEGHCNQGSEAQSDDGAVELQVDDSGPASTSSTSPAAKQEPPDTSIAAVLKARA